MTLAQEMYNQFSPNGNQSIQRNIDIVLEDIKNAMKRGESFCRFDRTWTDLPDDWVIMDETIDYLRDNGFSVCNKSEGEMFVIDYVIVTWPNVK